MSMQGKENRKAGGQAPSRLSSLVKTPEFLRLVRYGVTGVITTVINIGLFTLLYERWGWNENVSNIIAIFFAVLFAYLASKWFVFRTRCENRLDLVREAVSFLSARAVTMALELGGIFVFVTLLGWPGFWVKAALTVIVVSLNYVFSKLFVFKGEAPRPGESPGEPER